MFQFNCNIYAVAIERCTNQQSKASGATCVVRLFVLYKHNSRRRLDPSTENQFIQEIEKLSNPAPLVTFMQFCPLIPIFALRTQVIHLANFKILVPSGSGARSALVKEQKIVIHLRC